MFVGQPTSGTDLGGRLPPSRSFLEFMRGAVFQRTPILYNIKIIKHIFVFWYCFSPFLEYLDSFI